jgi:hypothetical protein
VARIVKIIKSASVKFGAAPVPPAPIDPATLTDYGCQVVEARITATPNTTDVPATFCEPASKINVPSSFDLELQGLQDWGEAASFSQFLFDNDAEQMAFALYIDDTTDPEATGIVSIAAGDFGGVAGEVLVLKLTLPILGKPTIGPGTMVAGAEAQPEQTDQQPEPVAV